MYSPTALDDSMVPRNSTESQIAAA